MASPKVLWHNSIFEICVPDTMGPFSRSARPARPPGLPLGRVALARRGIGSGYPPPRLAFGQKQQAPDASQFHPTLRPGKDASDPSCARVWSQHHGCVWYLSSRGTSNLPLSTHAHVTDFARLARHGRAMETRSYRENDGTKESRTCMDIFLATSLSRLPHPPVRDNPQRNESPDERSLPPCSRSALVLLRCRRGKRGTPVREERAYRDPNSQTR